jgi:hypothetical protein
MAKFTDEEWEALKIRAAELGREHGTNAGSWVNVDSEKSARWWLKGMADGDPAVLDQLPDQPLSGKYSDSYSRDKLYADLDITREADSDDLELCQAYEEAHTEALHAEVERMALLQLGE